MLDVENEAGLMFTLCTLGVYVMEIGVCWSILRGRREEKGILIGYSVSSIISFCLLLTLFAGGTVPTIQLQTDCNGVLALYGITWAVSQFCFVRLIRLLDGKNSLKKSPEE